MSEPSFHMIAGAPDPVAPFSHAVEQDGWIFLTGQMPFSGTANDSPYPEGIEATERNYAAWEPTDEGLLVTFQPYQVAPYALGLPTVTVPWDAFEP